MEEEMSTIPVSPVTENRGVSTGRQTSVTGTNQNTRAAQGPGVTRAADVGEVTEVAEVIRILEVTGVTEVEEVTDKKEIKEASAEMTVAQLVCPSTGCVQDNSEPRCVSVLPPLGELVGELRQRFLQCVLCEEALDAEGRCPRKLPCIHAVCSACLGRCGPGRQLTCPHCHVQGNGQEALPSDLTRLQLLELLASARPAQSTGDQQASVPSPEPGAELLARLLEELLTCAICRNVFDGAGRAPRALPCLHGLCASCSLRLADGGGSRCHECRKTFTAEQASREDLVLQELLEWLQPFREALPALTSALDPTTARMCLLQDLLQRKEREVHRSVQAQGEPQSFTFRMGGRVEVCVRRRACRFGSRQQEAWKSLAEVCMDIVREIHTVGANKTRDVWSTAKLTYKIMMEHSEASNFFSQALAEIGAVEFFTDNCSHQPYLDNISDEHVVFILCTSLALLHCLVRKCKNKQVFLEGKTLEVTSELVRMEHMESGVASQAAQLLCAFFSAVPDHSSLLTDRLSQPDFARYCVWMLKESHEKCLGGSDSASKTAHSVYKMVCTLSSGSKEFSQSLAAQGAVHLLTKNCTLREYLDEITNDNLSFIVDFSLGILVDIGSAKDTEHYFQESNTVQVLASLISVEYAHSTVLMRALLMVAVLYDKDIDHRQELGDTLARLGVAQAFIRIRNGLKAMNSVSRVLKIKTNFILHSLLWNLSDASALMAKALGEAGAVEVLSENLRPRFSLEGTGRDEKHDIMASLGILQNIARRPGLQHFFAQSDLEGVLIPFIDSEEEEIHRMTVFMLASHILDIQSPQMVNEGLTRRMVTLLKQSLETTRWRERGFAALEMVQSLAKQVLNDAIRAQMLEMDVVPVLDKMVAEGNSEEQDIATLCKERLLVGRPGATAAV